MCELLSKPPITGYRSMTDEDRYQFGKLLPRPSAPKINRHTVNRRISFDHLRAGVALPKISDTLSVVVDPRISVMAV